MHENQIEIYSILKQNKTKSTQYNIPFNHPPPLSNYFIDYILVRMCQSALFFYFFLGKFKKNLVIEKKNKKEAEWNIIVERKQLEIQRRKK